MTSSVDARATLWDTSTGAATVLATLPNNSSTGTNFANAFDINDSGFVAGLARNYSSGGTTYSTDAAVWNGSGTIFDLNSYLPANSGWVLTSANSISNGDWVSGTGTFTDATGSYPRDFLLQLPAAITSTAAVPEPASLLALGVAAVPMLTSRRRRRAAVAAAGTPVGGRR